MQVLEYRRSEPTTSPPHNSWLLDNQTPTSSVPHPLPSSAHHSLPLVSSNSLTGISSHNLPASSTPLRTSSSSTLQPSSHPSHATSDVYPSQHPSAPRASPVNLHLRLNNLNHQDNLSLDETPNSNSINHNTHSTASKLGNLLNVNNDSIEHDRGYTQLPLSRSGSNQAEHYRDVPSNSYSTPAQSFSAPLEYRQTTHHYHDHHHLKHSEATPYDHIDPYQPMHRPHFPSQMLKNPNNGQVQPPSSHRQDCSEHTSNGYHNNYSPPYPGTAPMPIYKQHTYGIPKLNTAVESQRISYTFCQPNASSVPSFKPSQPSKLSKPFEPRPTGTKLVSKPMPSRSFSPPTANGGQRSSYVEVHDLAVGGTLLRDTIQSFQEKGMTQERAEFLQDYTELMKAYEEKCDVVYDATERMCMELMLKSRVPLLEDTITAPVDDETPEDASQKLVVKRKFVEAMEALQGEQLPTKRRGNLPKECTEYLKKWFDDHYDHPYPTDEQKLEMSKRTKIGMSQISHWFINYRKRVWKPSLPANHPAVSGENPKKTRKKQKTGEDARQVNVDI